MSINTTNAAATTTNAADAGLTTTPVESAYVYDPATVVAAYNAGAVRLDVARRAANAAMGAALDDDDIVAAKLHRGVIAALDNVASATRSAARVITVDDYVNAAITRAVAMRAAAYAVVIGDAVPTDVPADMRAAYIAAMDARVGTGFGAWDAVYTATRDAADDANDDDRDATAYATRRVIGNSSTARHYADIAAGNAYDRAGALFVPVAGTIYPFAVIAGLRTSAYPNAELTHGAAAAAFYRAGAVRDPGYAGWTYATLPASARATHGVRFDGPAA